MTFLKATRSKNKTLLTEVDVFGTGTRKTILWKRGWAHKKQPVQNQVNNSPNEQNQNASHYFFPIHWTNGKEHLPASLNFLVRARRRRLFCHRHRWRT